MSIHDNDHDYMLRRIALAVAMQSVHDQKNLSPVFMSAVLNVLADLSRENEESESERLMSNALLLPPIQN